MWLAETACNTATLEAIAEDLTQEFVEDCVFPALRAAAVW